MRIERVVKVVAITSLLAVQLAARSARAEALPSTTDEARAAAGLTRSVRPAHLAARPSALVSSTDEARALAGSAVEGIVLSASR